MFFFQPHLPNDLELPPLSASEDSPLGASRPGLCLPVRQLLLSQPHTELMQELGQELVHALVPELMQELVHALVP